ncbi:MAG: hypothetical protein GX896_10720 [Clostridiales bacterium]|nr:hypothetical protein [Clostridiales bacterium]
MRKPKSLNKKVLEGNTDCKRYKDGKCSALNETYCRQGKDCGSWYEKSPQRTQPLTDN